MLSENENEGVQTQQHPPELAWPLQLLDDRTEWVNKPLPKGWNTISVHSAAIRRRLAIHVHLKYKQAQWEHPSKKPYGKITSLPKVVTNSHSKSKLAQLLPISPQPPTLMAGWIQVIQVPAKFNPKLRDPPALPQLLYVSVDGVTQAADPTPLADDDDESTLPEGWEIEYDAEDHIYFVNRNRYMCTYDDPRVFPNPLPSDILKIEGKSMRQSRRISAITFEKAEGSKAAWRLSAKDQFKFNLLENNLAEMAKDVPEFAQNKKVNRYIDIVPHAHTRVVLRQDGPDPLSTYINANWVSGFESEKKFIAAMGPLPATVVNFWRMIIEHNVEHVCMLTNLVEKGKKKCHPYFPIQETEVMELGPFEIKNQQRDECDGFVKSKMLVKWGKEKRTVTHWWFNSWPDHDVPRDHDGNVYVESLLDLVDSIKKADSNKGPIVVHCSAGVGRTGTFIGVHNAQEELLKNKSVDLIDIIEKMRTERSAMVQHLSQFMFVHDSITRFCEIKGKSYIIDGADADNIMELAKSEDQDEEDALGDDDDATEANRKKLRMKEKEAAAARRKEYEEGIKSGKYRKINKTESETSGEILLGPIEFEGKEYHFNDINGDGVMDWSEAQADGYPKELFKLITEGDGDVTVSKYSKFMAKMRKKAFEKTKVQTAGKSLHMHAEMTSPWYAGELSMMTVVGIVKESVRGNFLIRRSARNPSDFHIIACIHGKNEHLDAGKYGIKYNEDGLYLFGKKPYKSLEKIVAACRKQALLQDSMGPYKLVEPAMIFNTATA